MFKFIVFEGIDGCGKTTQSVKLWNKFCNSNLSALLTREPTSLFRDTLLYNDNLLNSTELFLLLADRSEHVLKIKKNLAIGHVICDRYTGSTLAYQGAGRGVSYHLLKELNRIATKGLCPHLTFVLDIPVEIMFDRLSKRHAKDRFERNSKEFFNRVRNYYRDWSNYPGYIVVDGTQSIEMISNKIWKETKCLILNGQEKILSLKN